MLMLHRTKKIVFRFGTSLAFLILSLSSSSGESPKLINIKKIAPNIVVDIRYATTDNFTKKVLYDTAACYLCEPAAKRLARVQKKLEKQGLGLKVWDCYRPLSVQWKLWHVVPDSRYVADPRHGSRHNRGASVDLTLVDANGNELPMPTDFDDFRKNAHRDYTDLPKNRIRNRQRLQDAMESEGFMGLPTEWWHFDDPEWRNFVVRDDPLSSARLKKDKKTPLAASSLPHTTKQLVLVTSKNWTDHVGQLERFEKVKGRWKKAGKPWPITLGTKGMAWGQGLHTALGSDRQKREGDLKTPAGLFPIGQGYGLSQENVEGSRWPYQPLDQGWRCVDDPKSSYYNKVLPKKEVKKPDWSSAERMIRKDGLYKWVINIEQNGPAVLKGAGSCIFFHVWKRKGASTEGCTAMTEDNMKELLAWLKPQAKPHAVFLPRGVYRQVKKRWRLP